jgi:hypothetical protein
MARRILFAFSVAALFVASDAFAKGPFGTIKVGNWTGGAYTNDTTGAFSHCPPLLAAPAGGSFPNRPDFRWPSSISRFWERVDEQSSSRPDAN